MPFDRLLYKQKIIDLYTGINQNEDPDVPNGDVIENVAEELSQALQNYVGSGFNLTFKDAVKVATTAEINLSSSTPSIDGVFLSSSTVQVNGDIGDRVLVKNQTDQRLNGIYLFKGIGIPFVRASDFDNSGEIANGAYVFVQLGTLNQITAWVLSTPNPITLGVTNILFTQLSSFGGSVTGAPLTKVDDTNVTITLTGPDVSASVLAAVELTLGWVGQLSVDRGGTGLTTIPLNAVMYGNDASPVATVTPNATATRKFLMQVSGNAPTFEVLTTSDLPATTVTASGTANYVAKFTAPSTLGNSLIYDDGTRVGIGMGATTGNMLSVFGYVYTNDGNGYYGRMIASNGGWYIENQGVAAAKIGSAFSYFNGNLGIGTTTDAGYSLHVNGNTRIVGELYLGDWTTDRGPYIVQLDHNSVIGAILITTTNVAGQSTHLDGSGLRATRSTAGGGGFVAYGNTGIQINNSVFDITGSSALKWLSVGFYGTVVVNESGDPNGDFRCEGDTVVNLLFVDASTDRVGVGTNIPISKFSNTGTQLTDGSNGVSLNAIQWAVNDGGWAFGIHATNASSIAHGALIKAEGGRILGVQGAAGAFRLIVEQNGNVLIGLSADGGQKLQVSGSVNFELGTTGTFYVKRSGTIHFGYSAVDFVTVAYQFASQNFFTFNANTSRFAAGVVQFTNDAYISLVTNPLVVRRSTPNSGTLKGLVIDDDGTLLSSSYKPFVVQINSVDTLFVSNLGYLTAPAPFYAASGYNILVQNSSTNRFEKIGNIGRAFPYIVTADPTYSIATTSSVFIFTGTTTTWTLPAVSDVPTLLILKNRGTGAITLNANSGLSTIFDFTALSTLTINPGEAIMLFLDGTYWNVV